MHTNTHNTHTHAASLCSAYTNTHTAHKHTQSTTIEASEMSGAGLKLLKVPEVIEVHTHTYMYIAYVVLTQTHNTNIHAQRDGGSLCSAYTNTHTTHTHAQSSMMEASEMSGVGLKLLKVPEVIEVLAKEGRVLKYCPTNRCEAYICMYS
jgi:hypothetical protein